MGEIGLRLLQLQQEYADRQETASLASEFRQDGWQSRTEQEIAADYEATIRELLASPVSEG